MCPAARRHLVEHAEDSLDDGSHVVILVFSEAAAEDDAWLGICQCLVLGVVGVVALVIHRVEGQQVGRVRWRPLSKKSAHLVSKVGRCAIKSLEWIQCWLNRYACR